LLPERYGVGHLGHDEPEQANDPKCRLKIVRGLRKKFALFLLIVIPLQENSVEMANV